MSETKKPFWMRHPYLILFDLLRLHRVKPWDVNIANLLNAFLTEMKHKSHIDFSASGTALLSSSIIHRMKSELVLKLEDPPRPPPQRLHEDVPPPLPLPLRFEYTATPLSEVLQSIEEVIKSEVQLLSHKTSDLKPVPLVQELDDFITNVQDHLETLYHKLSHEFRNLQQISFTNLTIKMDMLEVVRTFILILFLASSGKVELFQNSDSTDIMIKVKGPREDTATIQYPQG